MNQLVKKAAWVAGEAWVEMQGEQQSRGQVNSSRSEEEVTGRDVQ
jgi:hypothetical protein